MFARAMLMIGSKVIAHSAFLLIGVVLAHSLNQTEFGTFNQVWLVNKSLLYLFELGLPVSVYYFLPRLAADQKKGFILQTMVSLTLFAIPFSASMALLAEPLSIHFNNPALAYHLRLFALYPLLTLPTISTEEILLSLEWTGAAALFESLTRIAMIMAVAIAAIVGNQLDWVFKALILSGVVQTVLGTWLVWQPVRQLPLKLSVAEWKSQFAYAVPYGLSTLSGALNYQVDKILVSLFNPPVVFAIYAAGAFEIPLSGVTSLPVVSVIMSDLTQLFAASDRKGFLALWHQSMRKLALPIFAVIAFLMVFAEPVVTLLFSATYVDSVWPFRIYLLFSPIRITVLEYILAALGKTQAIFKAQLIAMIVNITLGYLSITTTGWIGAACSAVLAGYLFATLQLAQIRERLQVSWGDVMPWRDLGKVGLVAIATAICTLPISLLAVGSFWKLSLGLIAYVTVYIIGNLKIKTISVSEIQALTNWLLVLFQSALMKLR
jgi:O-antigen/teichoic acid export membrane protein